MSFIKDCKIGKFNIGDKVRIVTLDGATKREARAMGKLAGVNISIGSVGYVIDDDIVPYVNFSNNITTQLTLEEHGKYRHGILAIDEDCLELVKDL